MGVIINDRDTHTHPHTTPWLQSTTSSSTAQVASLAASVSGTSYPAPQLPPRRLQRPAALTEMVKKTKVVVTTVGPYALYGSTLAKVCSQNGVHCVDLTGEPLWSREMLELYNEDAKRTKAILIHGSGFDSVPSDLNTLLAVKKLQSVTDVPVGDVVSFVSAKGEASGGTIATMLNQMDVIQDPVKNKQMQDPYLLSPIKGPQKVALALSYYHGNEVG